MEALKTKRAKVYVAEWGTYSAVFVSVSGSIYFRVACRHRNCASCARRINDVRNRLASKDVRWHWHSEDKPVPGVYVVFPQYPHKNEKTSPIDFIRKITNLTFVSKN